MAHDTNGSTSSRQGVSFNREVQKVEIQLLFMHEDHRSFRSMMTDKNTIYRNLCAQQLNICESINKYNKAWFEHALVHAESDARNIINMEVRALLQTLENWRAKLDSCKDMFISYFRRMKRHQVETRIAQEKLKKVSSFTELDNVVLPNLDWTKRIVDPGIEKFEDEWNDLALEPKIFNCLLRMQQLIDSDGQNAQNS